MSYYRNEESGYSEDYYDEPYADEGYYRQGYGVQPYDDSDYGDERPSGRSPIMLTVVLIVGILACSCLSCAMGIGLGLVVWEELNYAPTGAETPEASRLEAAPQSFVANWQPQDVVNTFVGAGLECENPQPLNAGAVPVAAGDAVQCVIPSLSPDYSAQIFAFNDPNQLVALRTYYDDKTQADLADFSWVFVKDNVLVHINGNLPDDWAGNYEAALNQM